ncbi:putative O-methyl transferase B [Rosellinia necatrix]|uniref:Putative O-methyl transferase B n=1 Tax=Rosellinia necatrix TaxID=77044 RepID=A0A1W2TNS7_ROSNE|nr:putative O-methyl transferase B [Rosellinia necatrix]
MNLQTATVQVGFDLELFKLLCKSEAPRSTGDISAETGADTALIGRILRYLAAIGAVDERASGQFAANHVTRNLAEKVTECGVRHYFASVSRQYQALPRFLGETGYAEPGDEVRTVFQSAWGTASHAFAWFGARPENLRRLNDFMAARREPGRSWLSVYPVEGRLREAGGCAPSRPLYVDVGGGIGHQCAQFRERYPDVPGRVVLQDLPHSIAAALPTPGVENMAHDFFEPQPVQGAKFYFMRWILHNHPHHKILKLLANTKAAMATVQDSILLIDEMILPETNAHVDAVAIDLTMMCAFAGMERTEKQWRSILDEAGLKLTNIYLYNPDSHESVMEVRLI